MLRQWLLWLLKTIESLCARLAGQLVTPEPGGALAQLRPPQHWLDMVKQRAPHLLDSLPPEIVVNQSRPLFTPSALPGKHTALSPSTATPPAAAAQTPQGNTEATFITTMKKRFASVTVAQEKFTDPPLPAGAVSPRVNEKNSSEYLEPSAETSTELTERGGRSAPTSRPVPRQAIVQSANAFALRSVAARVVAEEREASLWTQPGLTPSPAGSSREKSNSDGVLSSFESPVPFSWPRLNQPGLARLHAAGQFETNFEEEQLAWPGLQHLPREAPTSRLSQPAYRRKSDAEQRGTRWSE